MGADLCTVVLSLSAGKWTVVQCELSADLLCRKYWAERGQGEHKSARALKHENVKAQERKKGFVEEKRG